MLISGGSRQEETGDMLPDVGSIISPSTGASLTRGAQRDYYS